MLIQPGVLTIRLVFTLPRILARLSLTTLSADVSLTFVNKLIINLTFLFSRPAEAKALSRYNVKR